MAYNTMNISVVHKADYPWQYVDAENILHLMLKITGEKILTVKCIACDPCDTYKGKDGADLPHLLTYEMNQMLSKAEWKYYSLSLPMMTHKMRYHFLVSTVDGTYTIDEFGVSEKKEEKYVRPFFVPYTYKKTYEKTPEWCEEMIWYQIFPDRFSAGNDEKSNWKYEKITDKDYVYGGDIKGIIKKIPYLKNLGVKGIYFNPVFKAASIHRYDTIDYSEIDELLGDEEDFVLLCEKCHDNGIRIMLDGVYNHCSYFMPQFQDVKNKGRKSEYFDWFIIHNEKELLNFDIENNKVDFLRNPMYETFAFVPSMPKLNTENPEVCDYLIKTAEKWTKKCKIDAWRLDVPDEVHEDFLREFYGRIKKINPEAYIIGEIWADATRWLRKGLFDGVMNYPVYFAIRDFIATQQINAEKCAEILTGFHVKHPANMQKGMFNFCSTHDIPRISWWCKGDLQKSDLCYILTAAMQGQLSIYYGDEIGMAGGYDPDNRRCMPWSEDVPIRNAIKEAIKLVAYKEKGELCSIMALDEDLLVIRYEAGKVYINRSANEKILENGEVLSGENYLISVGF